MFRTEEEGEEEEAADEEQEAEETKQDKKPRYDISPLKNPVNSFIKKRINQTNLRVSFFFLYVSVEMTTILKLLF